MGRRGTLFTFYFSHFCYGGHFTTRFGFLLLDTEQLRATIGSLIRVLNSSKLTGKATGLSETHSHTHRLITFMHEYSHFLVVFCLQGWPNIVEWDPFLRGSHDTSWGCSHALMENRWCTSYNSSSYGACWIPILLVTQSIASSLSLLTLSFSSPFLDCHRAHHLYELIIYSLIRY